MRGDQFHISGALGKDVRDDYYNSLLTSTFTKADLKILQSQLKNVELPNKLTPMTMGQVALTDRMGETPPWESWWQTHPT